MASQNDRDVPAIEKLTGPDIYPLWNYQIQVIFKSAGLTDIVEGKSKIEDCDSDQTKKQWVTNDGKAQKYIMTTIDTSLLVHMLQADTSHKMMCTIKTIFEKDSDNTKCELLQKFHNFRFNAKSDVMTNISELKNLVAKLKLFDQDISDEMMMAKILCVAQNKFKFFSTAWDSIPKTERTLINLTTRLVLEEEKAKKEEPSETVTFLTQRNTRKRKYELRCYECRELGHIARHCTKGRVHTGNVENTNRFPACDHCNKTNHPSHRCFFKNKSKFNQNRTRKRHFKTENFDNDKHQREAHLVSYSDTKRKKDDFLVDTGTGDTMVNDINLLKDVTSTSIQIGTADKDKYIQASGKGQVDFGSCVLKDALYAPNLRRNLLSVHAITEEDGSVTFTRKSVIIRDKHHTEILRGVKDGSQWIVNKNQKQTFLAQRQNDHLIKWHRRLGHASFSKILKLKDITNGINDNLTWDEPNHIRCEVCLDAKQKRYPFNTEREKAKRPCEIIHSDVCGPISPISWDGKRYFITFLDDWSHYCEVRTMTHKDEAEQLTKNFVARAEAIHNNKVATFRCDNGGEYFSSDFKTWNEEKGTFLDYTIPYSSPLNGSSERLNRTILEKARALLHDSDLNINMWSEAVTTAAYLVNRLPYKDNDKVPVELWTGRKPNLKYLRVFGSTVHSKILTHLPKFAKRSQKLKLVGYTNNGYRLWDASTKKIIRSRDVDVDERIKINFKSEDESIKSKVNININDEVQIYHVGTDDQVADILTKPLDWSTFVKLRLLLNLA